MPAQPLLLQKREEVRAGVERGESDGVIAGRLGRCRTMVNREINRNGGRVVYSATSASTLACTLMATGVSARVCTSICIGGAGAASAGGGQARHRL
jgi:IS30 family transposase